MTRKAPRTLIAGLVISSTVSLAAAADNVFVPGEESGSHQIFTTTNGNGVMFARQALPGFGASTPGAGEGDIGGFSAIAQSRIIYLNKNGVTLTPGNNDARTNQSAIARSATTLRAWTPTAQVWTDTVSCLNDMFSRFNVQVVTTDPGNVPHIEAVFTADSMAALDPSIGANANRIGGVSPFTEDCRVIENSVVFTFSGVIGNNAQTACEVMAQEIVHSYGADHQLLASDPMTYLPFNGKRTFKDQTVSCGESTPRNCGINGSVCRNQQNSVALLTERVGLRNGTAPVIGSVSPSTGSVVPPGFRVSVQASDETAVRKVELLIDGVIVGTKTAAPWTFTTAATIEEGEHELTINVLDDTASTTQSLSVTVEKGATDPTTPPGGGNAANGDGEIQGGCAAGGGTGGAGALAMMLMVLVARRRR
jgi:uncharacterized protein (TIGR03382 family)